MDAERKQLESARRLLEAAPGMVLRATRRGALVLETENARRMMRRFAKQEPPGPDTGPAENPEPA